MASDPDRNRVDENNTIWKLAFVLALAYLVWSDRVAIVFNPGGKASVSELTARPVVNRNHAQASMPALTEKPAAPSKPKPEVRISMPAGALNNVTTAIDPEFAERHHLDAQEARTYLEKCREYVERFAPVAMAEQQKFGIPASITLAQGLLESNAGESKLARNTNNHFGIKCFSNKCRKGHCKNFSDDSHKDFFVNYQNVWSSYRAHSQFLKNTGRYAKLFKLSDTDYRAWARGLQKAGYATDKRYGDKLIAIIQNLGLEQYDRR